MTTPIRELLCHLGMALENHCEDEEELVLAVDLIARRTSVVSQIAQSVCNAVDMPPNAV